MNGTRDRLSYRTPHTLVGFSTSSAIFLTVPDFGVTTEKEEEKSLSPRREAAKERQVERREERSSSRKGRARRKEGEIREWRKRWEEARIRTL